MNKVGLLIIATNKYDVFINQLLRSVDKYFFNGHTVDIYLFVDKPYKGEHSQRLNILQIHIKHYPFPYATLYRYRHFTEHSIYLTSEYLFYLDVDMRIVASIGDEILPKDVSITATLHPGFYKGGGSWCTNKESKAFVCLEDRKKYYAGGFQGGTNKGFLNLAKYLNVLIQDDEKKGIMAEWHDESHLNAWLSGFRCHELSPSYCYPESWKLPFPKKILALDKNHAEIRS